MAIVINPSGKTRNVKDHGWLLRHQREVTMIEVSPQSHFAKPVKGFESRMIVTLHNHVRYITNWVSTSACRQWIAARRGLQRAVVVFY
jgi:hypothetical protein